MVSALGDGVGDSVGADAAAVVREVVVAAHYALAVLAVQEKI